MLRKIMINQLEVKMMSPFGNVLNTRESYSRFHQKLFTEVEVQFDNENPTWIPLDTLLAIEKTHNGNTQKNIIINEEDIQ